MILDLSKLRHRARRCTSDRAHFSTRAARCASLRPTRPLRPAPGTATLGARPCCAHVSLPHARRSLVRIDTAPFTDASSRGEASACPTRTRPLHCGLARPWMLYGRTFAHVTYPDTRRRSGLVSAATATMSTDANPAAAVYIMATVERSSLCALCGRPSSSPNLTRVWGVCARVLSHLPVCPSQSADATSGVDDNSIVRSADAVDCDVANLAEHEMYRKCVGNFPEISSLLI